MKRISKLSTITLLTLILFIQSLILPYIASACPGNWSGHQQKFGDATVSDAISDRELTAEPFLCASSVADPVYTHSGEFYYECTDLVIPGRGMDVDIKHIYRSGKAYIGQFGAGWTINYHNRLSSLDNGNVTILNGQGRVDEYVFNGTKYIAPAGFFEELVKNNDGSWTLTKAHGEKHIFDGEGKLTSIIDRNNNTLTFTYDSRGRLPFKGRAFYTIAPNNIRTIGYDYRLIKITDTVGREVDFTYNEDGRLTSLSDYAGRTVELTYDPMTNDLLSIRSPLTPQYPSGRSKIFTYDNAHRMMTITDARGQKFVTNHYNANGSIAQQDLGMGSYLFNYTLDQTTVTDRKGFVTTYTFNANNQVIFKEEFSNGLRLDDPPSYITAYTYNDQLLRTSETFSGGNGVKYVYDQSNAQKRAQGNVLEIRRKKDMSQADNNAQDLITTITYEANYNFLKTITDPKGNLYANTYDYELPSTDSDYGINGNVVKVEQPMVDGQIPTTGLSYNTQGQVTQVTDPNGNVTTYDYFPATGYIKTVAKDPAGINAVAEFTWDVFGYLDTVKDPNGDVRDYDFNEYQWLIQETNPLGYVSKYAYDANGNVSQIERQASDPAGTWQTTSFTYDILNNILTMQDPLNRMSTYTYDASELLASMSDAENNTTSYEYDERDLIFKITDANTPQGVTQYDYDINGNLKKIVDANSNATSYAYDNYDRLQTQTYADTSASQYTYDKNSNVLKHITPRGDDLDYSYDALNRRTAKAFESDAALNTTYIYDVGSRLTNANNTASEITYGYDTLNRVTSNTQKINNVNYNLTHNYDKDSNRTQIVYGLGKAVDYVYDSEDRLTEIKVNNNTLTQYIYDPLNRRTKRTYTTSTLQETTYQYDIANQLEDLHNKTTAGSTIGQYGYTYDLASNRISMSAPDGLRNYAYNDIYELTGVSGIETHSFTYDNVGNRTDADGTIAVANILNQYTTVGGVTLNYDTNGNLIGDGTNTYTYDEQGRLKTFSNGTDNANYSYDALNRRSKKIVNGNTTYFIYDGDEVIAEYNGSNTLQAEYVMGDSIDEVLTMERGGQTYYYHTDGLGSVTQITNSAGNSVEQYTYDSYGQPSVTSSAIGNPYMFTGRRWDEESQIYHYRNRAFDPKLGRFLQRDPLGYVDGMNLFSYTINSPTNYTDPYGEFAQVVAVMGGSNPIGWAVVGTGAVVYVGYKAYQEYQANRGKTCSVQKQSDKTNEGSSTEETPATTPENFDNVKGSKAKKNKKTGEIWEKDLLHKDHYEVYKNKNAWEKGKRIRDVFEDGRPKRKF